MIERSRTFITLEYLNNKGWHLWPQDYQTPEAAETGKQEILGAQAGVDRIRLTLWSTVTRRIREIADLDVSGSTILGTGTTGHYEITTDGRILWIMKALKGVARPSKYRSIKALLTDIIQGIGDEPIKLTKAGQLLAEQLEIPQ